MTATGLPSHKGSSACHGHAPLCRAGGTGLLDYTLPLLPHDELLLSRGDGTKKEEEMIRKDDWGYIPDKHSELMDVFSKTKMDTLARHWSIDHVINLEPGCKIPYGRVYNLSEVELKMLQAYIQTHLANGFIQRPASPAAAPMLFAKKKDGSL